MTREPVDDGQSRLGETGFSRGLSGMAATHDGHPSGSLSEAAGFRRDAPLRVSVILPTYGRAGYLGEAIDSILAQTADLHDIVVVDDGSTDETRNVVARFGARVTYMHQENSGKLAAIARGLDRIEGDLVWIMDDDDLADPCAIEALRRPFDDDPDCVLTYGRMTKFTDGEEGLDADVEVEYPTDDPRPFLVKLMEDCFVTGHPCILAKRSALESLRPFPSGIIASVDYYLHLGVARAGRAVFVDRQVLRQRQHGGARGSARHRYGEADRVARWVAQDRTLIAPLLETLPLRAYLREMPVTPDRRIDALTDPLERRTALLQRSSIAARKKLWPQALRDLSQAVDADPEQPLTRDEIHILSQVLGCRYGLDEVHDDPVLPAALREIAERHADATVLLVALSRPLLHQIKIARRERDPDLVRKTLRTWSRLMPLRATVAGVTGAFARNAGRLRDRILIGSGAG